jgi:hypothetical protein
LYNQQVKKVLSLLSSLPEDLRMDYQHSAEKLGAG